MSNLDLQEVLKLHSIWLAAKSAGEKANLSGADLSDANLSGADLSGADLSGSSGLIYADCSWQGHGECGRRLLAVRIDSEDVYFCGCFRGNENQLRDYIKRGDAELKPSRRIAFRFVKARMAEMKESAQ